MYATYIRLKSFQDYSNKEKYNFIYTPKQIKGCANLGTIHAQNNIITNDSINDWSQYIMTS